MTREEELEIILRVRAGDTDAFEALVLEHQNKVYSLALRMVGNEEDARDMAQEAFIRAFNFLSGFRGDSKFSVWLYRLTSNICIDFLRSRSKKQTVSMTWTDEDGEEAGELEIPDDTWSPEQQLERSLTRESVRRGLDSLSPQYREILLLREISGLSYEEIAKALNLEEGTVKSRIFRARKKLCDFLLREGNIPEPGASNPPKGGAGV
jgi:RNA polymerase sigma-70 factor (ECF subfamily)